MMLQIIPKFHKINYLLGIYLVLSISNYASGKALKEKDRRLQYYKRASALFNIDSNQILFVKQTHFKEVLDPIIKAGHTYFLGIFKGVDSMLDMKSDFEKNKNCSGRILSNLKNEDSLKYNTIKSKEEFSKLINQLDNSEKIKAGNKYKIVFLLSIKQKSLVQMWMRAQYNEVRKVARQHPDLFECFWISFDH